MRFPIAVSLNTRLLVVGRDFFERIGQLDEAGRELELNVTAAGRAELNWILDSGGALFRLTSQGLLRANPFQRLGLTRRRERFAIAPAASVTSAELSALIASLRDDSPDLPNVTDLSNLLTTLPPDLPLDRENLKRYFGE
jgi:hypothetical protein